MAGDPLKFMFLSEISYPFIHRKREPRGALGQKGRNSSRHSKYNQTDTGRYGPGKQIESLAIKTSDPIKCELDLIEEGYIAYFLFL